jgi:hypothetical protein
MRFANYQKLASAFLQHSSRFVLLNVFGNLESTNFAIEFDGRVQWRCWCLSRWPSHSSSTTRVRIIDCLILYSPVLSCLNSCTLIALVNSLKMRYSLWFFWDTLEWEEIDFPVNQTYSKHWVISWANQRWSRICHSDGDAPSRWWVQNVCTLWKPQT